MVEYSNSFKFSYWNDYQVHTDFSFDILLFKICVSATAAAALFKICGECECLCVYVC